MAQPGAKQLRAGGTKSVRHDMAALESATTALGTVTGGSLTLPESGVLLAQEAGGAALAEACAEVADTLAGLAPGCVLLTGRSDLATGVLARISLTATIAAYQRAANTMLAEPLVPATPAGTDGTSGSDGSGAERRADDGDGAGVTSLPTPWGAAVAAGAAVLDAIAVETTVGHAERTAGDLETQVAVLGALLSRGVAVRHETIGIPRGSSAVLDALVVLRLSLTRVRARAVEAAALLAAVEKKAEPEAHARLTADRSAATALADDVAAFVEHVETVADGGSPLLEALRAEQLAEGVTHVAVVLPARIGVHQIALRRRIFSPRVVVSASAWVDLVVVDVASGAIVVAGPVRGTKAFQLTFPMWSLSDRLPRYQEVATLTEAGVVAVRGAAAEPTSVARRSTR